MSGPDGHTAPQIGVVKVVAVGSFVGLSLWLPDLDTRRGVIC